MIEEKDAIQIHTLMVKISSKIEATNKKQVSEGLETLTMAEARALFILYHSKNGNMGSIARQLNVAVSTATSVIDRLVKRNLAKRWVPDDDRRQWIVDLTPNARELASEMEKHAVEGTMKFLECLSTTEIVFLKEILDKIDKNLNTLE